MLEAFHPNYILDKTGWIGIKVSSRRSRHDDRSHRPRFPR
jgi:hypothetical protein